MTVVQDSAQLDRQELIPEGSDVPIKRKALDINVGHSEDGRSWSLITSTRLDTDESVFDHIDPSDSVLTSEGVQDVKDVNGISIGLVAVRKDSKFDRKTLLELDGDLIGGVRSRLRRLGQLPHIGRRSDVGILEDTSFIRNVEHVLVSRPGLCSGLADRNLFFSCVFKQGLTASKSVVKF